MNMVELDNINKLPKNILTNINNNDIDLKVNFNIDCEKEVNIFLLENRTIKNYYLEENYNISINLIDYNQEIYLWLIDCIQKASKKILSNKKYIKLFENVYQWNICICSNIMFNYPFTLSNIIYLPLTYIEFCFSNNDTLKFIETLIHEKIHLGQREKEKEWEKFINNNSKNWIKIKSNTDIFNLLQELTKNNDKFNFISNPDTFYKDFKYIYKDTDKKYYYGQYIFDEYTKQIKIKYLEIDINKKIFIPTNKVLEEEHPYEIYAYKISKELCIL